MIANCETRLAELAGAQARRQAAAESLDYLDEYCGRIAGSLDDLPFEERRKMLRLRVEPITAEESKVRSRWCCLRRGRAFLRFCANAILMAPTGAPDRNE